MGYGGVDEETPDYVGEPIDPGKPTREEAEASRRYRGCPLGDHEPDEAHHYTCWAWMDL